MSQPKTNWISLNAAEVVRRLKLGHTYKKIAWDLSTPEKQISCGLIGHAVAKAKTLGIYDVPLNPKQQLHVKRSAKGEFIRASSKISLAPIPPPRTPEDT
jgi:hypothetical protein